VVLYLTVNIKLVFTYFGSVGYLLTLVSLVCHDELAFFVFIIYFRFSVRPLSSGVHYLCKDHTEKYSDVTILFISCNPSIIDVNKDLSHKDQEFNDKNLIGKDQDLTVKDFYHTVSLIAICSLVISHQCTAVQLQYKFSFTKM